MLAQQVDDLDALAGRLQATAVAHDVADVDQALDDGRARGGRADAGVLHGLAQLVVLDELAGALHGGEQRGLAVARRRLGLARVGLDLGAVHLLALLERRQLLIGALVLVALDALGLGLVGRSLAVDGAPAGLEHDLAARAEALAGDLGQHGRVLEHGLRVERGQEAARGHVVDALLVGRELDAHLGRVRRDDRVVIGDLLVVDDAPERAARRGPARRRRLARTPWSARPTSAGDLLELGDHVARRGSGSPYAGS